MSADNAAPSEEDAMAAEWAAALAETESLPQFELYG